MRRESNATVLRRPEGPMKTKTLGEGDEPNDMVGVDVDRRVAEHDRDVLPRCRG